MMTEEDIKKFWNDNPCGESSIVGLIKDKNYEEFFEEYDASRYATEGHILRCLDRIDFRKKRVLEIGLGQGADAEQLIRRGAIWSGLDLTPESVNRVRTRLQLRQLPYEQLKCGSALDLLFSDNSFDFVFSHGVLHHIPEISKAQAEIARVLRPGGLLIAMLYARRSLNFVLSIAVLRRLGLLGLYLLRLNPGGIYGAHLQRARESGLFNYLKMSNFIHCNTDGPFNPYSKVYSVREVVSDFRNFTLVASHQEFLHAPPLLISKLPISKWPLAKLLGWHLWVYLRPNKPEPPVV